MTPDEFIRKHAAAGMTQAMKADLQEVIEGERKPLVEAAENVAGWLNRAIDPKDEENVVIDRRALITLYDILDERQT